MILAVEGPTSPVLTIDDVPVPQAALGVKRAVNPGTHALKASAEGFLPNETTFTVLEGDSAAVSLTLERKPAAPIASGAAAVGAQDSTTGELDALDARGSRQSWSMQKTMGFVAMGVGAVGIVVGGAAGAIALGKHGKLVDSCPAGKCQGDQQSTLDSYRTMGTISTIGFVVGAVGGVAGVTLLLTAPRTAEKAEIRALVGFGQVGAELSFQ